MFTIYTRVHERLSGAGYAPVHAEVGEFVTSLDMAGVSLSVMVLDDELAQLYAAPCDTPAYRSSGARYTTTPVVSTPDTTIEVTTDRKSTRLNSSHVSVS